MALAKRERGLLPLWQRLFIIAVMAAAVAKWHVYFMQRQIEGAAGAAAPQRRAAGQAAQAEVLPASGVGAERGALLPEEAAEAQPLFFFPATYEAPWRPQATKLGAINFLLHGEQFTLDGNPGNGSTTTAVLTYPLWANASDADGANRHGLAASIAEELGIGVYKFPARMVRRLPRRPPRLRYASCAVVGNSGELLQGALGAEIDAHDMVIRMNAAPTKGFEQHVGNKTTFGFVNHAHFKRLATMAAHRVPAQMEGKGSLVLFESTIYQAYFHIYEELTARFPPKELAMVIVSPDFTSVSYELWRRMCDIVIQETKTEYVHKKPSSGWFATVFSAQVCDQVDLYGFEAYHFTRGSKKRTTKYHYFDEASGFTNVHSFELSIKVFQRLAQMGFRIRLAHPETGVAGLK
mmetsp:Transcript_48064/g.120407  ORF Transcript_48064/g.120407 Transcript_48064/m.120407 type:complete len:407 (-) Transcript_48064:202-1422(-)